MGVTLTWVTFAVTTAFTVVVTVVAVSTDVTLAIFCVVAAATAISAGAWGVVTGLTWFFVYGFVFPVNDFEYTTFRILEEDLFYHCFIFL
jgi:hypothetical protein